ncbi:MAG: DUF1493 family protein [Chitinophagaceae bacterium]
MYFLQEVFLFLENQTGCELSEFNSETDIHTDLGVSGDDFHEMIDEFSKKFNVDIASYLWYFHTEEEGGWNSIGSSFFKPPNERVTRIPVTPGLLLESANLGKWKIEYPEHKLPKRRYDIIINGLIVLPVFCYLLYRLIKWIL